MSLLVGLRGDNIGSDTLRHIEFIRSAGEFDGIDSLLAVKESIRIEIGNILIMQLANSFGDVHLFFIIMVLCQDLVQHKMRNFNYFQLTNSDSLATLAL